MELDVEPIAKVTYLDGTAISFLMCLMNVYHDVATAMLLEMKLVMTKF